MAKYIELNVGRKHGSTLLTPEEFAEYLDELPAADVAPVRTADDGIINDLKIFFKKISKRC